MTVRGTAAALACAALLSTTVAGCSSAPAATSTKPAAVVTDPKQTLAGVAAGQYKWDITVPGGHLAGAVDRPGRNAQWSTRYDNDPGNAAEHFLIIGTDQYVMHSADQATAGADPIVPNGTWEHIDLARLSASSASPEERDPLGQPDLIGLTTLVQKISGPSATGGVIHGKLDLATLGGNPPQELLELGPWWSAGPLTTTVETNGQGRLTRLTADLPPGGTGIAAGKLVIAISGYGEKGSPAKPSPVAEAPAVLYQAS